MFMHGDLAHLGGNLLYLWVFGDNLEDKLGHLRYLFFYIFCGIIASLTHVFTDYFFGASHLIPSLGHRAQYQALWEATYYCFLKEKLLYFSFLLFLVFPHLLYWGLGYCCRLPMAQDI